MKTLYDDVNDWLSVGGDLDLARDLLGWTPARTIKELQAYGVSHVLDLRSEWNDFRTWTVLSDMSPDRYEWLPIVDSFGHTPPDSWCTGVEAFVRRFLSERSAGGRLYAHCHMGINRAPSAAMLALLTAEPDLDPFDAFLRVREARAVAGAVYAEPIGARHLRNAGKDGEIGRFLHRMDKYWDSERRHAVSRGIAYYRGAKGGTEVAGYVV